MASVLRGKKRKKEREILACSSLFYDISEEGMSGVSGTVGDAAGTTASAASTGSGRLSGGKGTQDGNTSTSADVLRRTE